MNTQLKRPMDTVGCTNGNPSRIVSHDNARRLQCKFIKIMAYDRVTLLD